MSATDCEPSVGHLGGEVGAAEERHVVERLAGERGQLLLQLGELGIVVREVVRVLGRIGVQGLELADAVKNLAGDLEHAVLRLQEGHGVSDVGVRSGRTLAAADSFIDTARPPASSAGFTIFEPEDNRLRLRWSMLFEAARLLEQPLPRS